MTKIDRIKVPVMLTENGEILIDSSTMTSPIYNWQLVREHDGLTKQSKDILWLEWDENGFFKKEHKKPAMGYSLIMSPFSQYFTWQTTAVTELIEVKSDYIKFKTKNSVYELKRLYDEATGNPI